METDKATFRLFHYRSFIVLRMAVFLCFCVNQRFTQRIAWLTKAPIGTAMKKTFIYCVIPAMLLFLSVKQVFSETDIKPSNVYGKVKEISEVVERLRYHMGVPKAAPMRLRIMQAQPHDVFFQAMTLFRNTNRLLFQVTRSKAPEPAFPKGHYLPKDVYMLLELSLSNLSAVLNELNLSPTTEILSGDSTEKTPSEVFLAIQAVNRQINLLLELPITPSDVYMQVTLAIEYCARQLARFPHAQRIPEAPEIKPGRVPSDVYFRLLDGLEKIKQIYELLGLSSLTVDATALQKEEIKPSDVFEMASLLVARLDFLHKYNKIEKLPREPFYPGKVYPSDVYRQAGILMSQLDSLLELYKRETPK